VSRRRCNISRLATLPCVTEYDLLDNAVELLRQPIRAADGGRYCGRQRTQRGGRKYFEDAEVIAAAKCRVSRDDAA